MSKRFCSGAVSGFSLSLVLSLFLSLFIAGSRVAAQTFGVGASVNESLLDYGFGLNIASPQIAESFQFRLSGNVQGLIGTSNSTSRSTLYGYGLIRLGVVGRPAISTEHVRVYAEGGPLLLLNNREASSKQIGIGGYGVLGMEYRIGPVFWLFLEGGGIGTGADADKLIGSPAYSTGLFFGMGVRLYWGVLNS